MNNKKKLIFSFVILNAIISVSSFASWWGNMSKTERASVIATGALLTKDRYDKYRDREEGVSEAKYKQDMKELEERLRKEYDSKLEQGLKNNKRKVNPNMPVPIEETEIVNTNYNNKYLQKEQKLKEAEDVVNQSQMISEKELEELKKLSEQAETNNKEQ